MKNNQLTDRLVNFEQTDHLIEIIKVSDLSEIQGGDCPALTSCGNYVDCGGVYKKGDKDTDIKIDVPIIKP